jgi:hypothetical protein
MASSTSDEEREKRIMMEIVVDAYGEEERALSWYYYLEEKLQFPFRAKCIAERSISPLRVSEEVEVVGMPPEAECEHDMFVKVQWLGRDLAVPLSQLQGIEIDEDDEETQQAIEDWHYWVDSGNEF